MKNWVVNIKIIAVILTCLILVLLIITGPAKAFILGFSILDNEVDQGEIINFVVSLEIEANEYMEIDYFTLKLSGPVNISCMFNTNATIISGCTGISITQISSAPYNFGYGFEEGLFEYNITLDSLYYAFGIYKTELVMVSGSNEVKVQGRDILIKRRIDELAGCSIRGEYGDLMVKGQNLGDNNHISFYIPLNGAGKGSGNLIGQSSRKRVSYSFDIIDLIENNEDYARISISGKYKINRGDEIIENAVIFFDKINNLISLEGSDIVLKDAEIVFREKC